MAPAEVPRIFVVSSRPDILPAVARAAAELQPSPTIIGFLGRYDSLEPGDLVLVDAGEPRASPGFLRGRFGGDVRLVALLDVALVERFGDALSGDWYDYLFFPINRAELGLVWRRHTSAEPAPAPTLDVDEEGRIRLALPSSVEPLRPAVERIVEAARHLGGLGAGAAFRVRVALGEALANAVLYGSGEDPGRLVHIALETEADELRITVRDEGEGFDPESVPDPTGEGLERNRGRGLLLMRTMCDDLRFSEAGNEVTLVFRGALDPLERLALLLGPYAEVSGLRFRVERLRPGGPETLFDGLSPAPGRAEGSDAGRDAAEGVATRRIGSDGLLRLSYREGPGGGPAAAADLLGDLLEVFAESDAAREEWIRRRLRRERVLAELEVARDLQLRLLPSADAFSDLSEVAARCDPALSLGGDFYFLARLPRGRLGVMLGDVSSHGPSAALIMALTLSAAAMATESREGAGAVLSEMQEQLLRALESTEMYMTLFYAVVDPTGGTVSFANAGHPYAYRVGPEGSERLRALNPPIGMSAPPAYGEETRAWPRGGDTLLLFTDGLTRDLVDPMESEDPAIRRAIAAAGREPHSLVRALFEAGDDDVRLDDRTAVAVRP